MDKVEYPEQEMLLIDPKPGTAAAAAREFGINLSITVSNLRLTPEQRIRKLDEFQYHKAQRAFDAENDREIAVLLELEAILEDQRASETQQD